MFAIIGILVVFGAVVGGYLMEKGPLAVLLQPAELLIILGAAVATVLIANPPHVLKAILNGIATVFGGSGYNEQRYIDSLKMLYDLFNRARRDGLSAVESDIEDPEKSAVFSNYKAIIKNHHVRDFVCDTMRTASAGRAEILVDILEFEVHECPLVGAGLRRR